MARETVPAIKAVCEISCMQCTIEAAEKQNVSNVVYISGSFSLVIEKKKKEGARKIELEAY